MRAHEAGALHGNDLLPSYLPFPEDVNALLPGLWPTSADRRDDGTLEIGGLGVDEILQQVGSPAIVLDEDDFRIRARRFRDAFTAAFAAHSGADVFYAGKAYLSVAVARWMAEDGLGLDVCSAGELAVALRGGVDPARIVLHGNNKSDAEVRRALDVGVGLIVVDSLPEIEQVRRLAAETGTVAPVMLRVTVGVEAHTHEFIATAHEDQKFGLSIAGGDAMAAVGDVLAAPDRLHLVGLHSHIGSQIMDMGGFEVAIQRLVAFAAEVRDAHDHQVAHLDLGGGFGVRYTSQFTPSPPTTIADEIARALARACESHGLGVPRVSVEPGRAIAGPAGVTVYTVGTVKDVLLEGGFARKYVSVDGGMSDNIRTALYDADYSASLVSRSSDAEPAVSRVVGRHCESGDIVVKDEYLPSDTGRGDLVAVPVTGAYCYSMASNYNHVPRPPVVSVRDGQVSVQMRRETLDDLLGLDQG